MRTIYFILFDEDYQARESSWNWKKKCAFLRKLIGTLNTLEEISSNIFPFLGMKMSHHKLGFLKLKQKLYLKAGVETQVSAAPLFFRFSTVRSFDRCWHILLSAESPFIETATGGTLSTAPGLLEID